jgi:hypothetical protein
LLERLDFPNIRTLCFLSQVLNIPEGERSHFKRKQSEIDKHRERESEREREGRREKKERKKERKREREKVGKRRKERNKLKIKRKTVCEI